MKKIDHIVYAVPDLEKGMDEVEHRFGIRPVYGGKHLHQGTHNALLNLGNACYFELIAVDPENKTILAPRWMGIDLLTEPKVTRWAIKSTDLEQDLSILKTFNPELAKTKTGNRQRQDGSMLEWQLSIPLAYPEVEVLPFLLDWKDSVHPTETMPQHCELISIRATHPQGKKIARQLEALGYPMLVEESEVVSLMVEIMTPKGIVRL